MNRRKFVSTSAVAATGLLILGKKAFAATESQFPVVRLAASRRNFTSTAVEATIAEIDTRISNRELAWLFNNCFPNTLDTTVDYSERDGVPDTYVITGDIDAMWLRDSSAQVWPYLPLAVNDAALRKLIAGVIHRQTHYILKDPYANAFYKNDHRISDWKKDLTDMKPGIHERKWEIDSLCYPIRLSYGYWKTTGDTKPFDAQWKNAVKRIIQTFRTQQRFHGRGPYSFMRNTAFATDSVPLGGYGYPVRPNGLICSMFRPSDDATVFPYLIPSNLFAVTSLFQVAEMLKATGANDIATQATDLAHEVQEAVNKYGTVEHPVYGKIYAYEVNGMGSCNLMDDANVPSLLSLPYLCGTYVNHDIYLNTRRFVLSADNPFYFSGKAATGIGGPHVGVDYIWPLSIIMRGITAQSDEEITTCLRYLQKAHAGTGFMHEAFHKEDFSKFTRSWFAWANTLFGEFILKVYHERPHLLSA